MKRFVFLILTTLVSGCISPWGAEHSCPIGTGVPCANIATIDKLADAGFFDEKEFDLDIEKIKRSKKFKSKQDSGLEIYFPPKKVGDNKYTKASSVYTK